MGREVLLLMKDFYGLLGLEKHPVKQLIKFLNYNISINIHQTFSCCYKKLLTFGGFCSRLFLL